MKNVANFLLFQAGWFSCILGAANGLAYLGPAIVGPVLILHLAWVAKDQWRQELSFLFLAAAAGVMLDTAMSLAGVMAWREADQPAWLCPAWLLALWLIFPTSVGYSLGWMQGRTGLAALFGFLGGPAAYYAGAHLGAVHLPGSLPLAAAIGIMGTAWALFFPLLFVLRAWCMRAQ